MHTVYYILPPWGSLTEFSLRQARAERAELAELAARIAEETQKAAVDYDERPRRIRPQWPPPRLRFATAAAGLQIRAQARAYGRGARRIHLHQCERRDHRRTAPRPRKKLRF